MTNFIKFAVGTFTALIFSLSILGQVQSSDNSIVTVNFNSTLAGVNNGAFNGSGFTPTPAVGQLDSDAFAITGLQDGTLTFGGTQTGNDFARGSTTGGEVSGGIYNINPNIALGVQPAGNDFTPGTITLRIQNTGPSTMTQVTVSYNILVNNDQNRSSSFNFSYSTNDTTYTALPALNFTSTAASDAMGFQSVTRITNITGLTVASGSFFYIRWTGEDVGGSGSRDEFAIDNIVINRLAPTAALGSITGRARYANGNGIKKAVVMLSGGNLNEPVYATTNQFGYYQFADVEVGESYVLQIMSGRYIFQNPSRLISLDESITDQDFIVDEPPKGTNSTKQTEGGVLIKRVLNRKL